MRSVLAFGVAAAVSMAACGDSSTSMSGTGGPSGAGGVLNLRITDAPFEDAKSLLVTFSEVSVHRADAAEDSWITVPFADGGAARTCDLKKLQDLNEDILGVGTLEAGHYTQVRLVVAGAALYFDNPAAGPACAPAIEPPAGEHATLEVPSGAVKLVRQFTIPEGGATTMLLDFDGGRSVHQTGNGRYMMKPVIGVVSVQ